MRCVVVPGVVVTALLAVATPAASAATVGNAATVRLDFFAGASEANRVTVTRSGDRLVVTDLGVTALQVEGTCMVDTVDPRTASCPAAAITALSLSGGSLDDEITNLSSIGGELHGGEGGDLLRGGGGAERLDGGQGRDHLDGGAGDDRVYGATLQNPEEGSDTDQLIGGLGNDRLFGSGGLDGLDGGSGTDQLDGGGGADGLQGGEGTDVLVGGGGADVEDGGNGDDTLGTEITLGVVETPQDPGDDVLLGGAGNDTLIPGPGSPLADADTINGGDGSDAVSYRARMTPVNVSKDGAADDGGMAERDNIGLDIERIIGGQASDMLRGSPGAGRSRGAPWRRHA